MYYPLMSRKVQLVKDDVGGIDLNVNQLVDFRVAKYQAKRGTCHRPYHSVRSGLFLLAFELCLETLYMRIDLEKTTEHELALREVPNQCVLRDILWVPAR